MQDILQKLSTYNFFNYLLPGIIFVLLLRSLTSFDLVVDELLIGVFSYYFIGMVISRIGAILIAPILKKSKTIKFLDYQKFVLASKEDKKIELFSEINNMYRTFISMFMVLIFIIIYENINLLVSINDTLKSIFGLIALMFLFIFSYREQTQYINKRINMLKEE